MRVKIKQGILEGKKDTSITTGRDFYSFLGIPYAEPPVGELRFQPPVPASSWDGIRDAKYHRNRCLQLNLSQPNNSPQNECENCLYVNVFTTKLPNRLTSLKPVMVHIHGGGYMFGDGSMEVASPDHLINYGIVFVSFNYRLNIFGFLNLKTPTSTGNCGCKDQVLALKWVQENIIYFGGDPKNVTIFGESSGANSVHLLTISPLATGLFHKAIVESGTIIAPWINEDQVEAGFKIGRKLGFEGTDVEELVEFLKARPAETLVQEAKNLVVTQKTLIPAAMSSVNIFAPSIERPSSTAFLTDYPINLILDSKPIPMIAGVAQKEGVCVLFGLENSEDLFERLKCDLTELVKSNVPCDPSKIPEITEKVQEYYFGPLINNANDDGANDEKIRETVIEIYSHLFFRSFYDVIHMTTRNSAPLYVYRFDYVGNLNESLHWSMGIPGALHADESEYITLSRGLHPRTLELTESDQKVINNLCTAWTNFAKTSNPNPLPENEDAWDRFTVENPSFMVFNAIENGRMREVELEFWKRIFRHLADWTDTKTKKLQLCTMEKGRIWEEGLEFWTRIFYCYVDWNDNKNKL